MVLPQQPTIAEQLGAAFSAGIGGVGQGLSQRQQLKDQLEFERVKQKGSLTKQLLDAQLKASEKQERAEAFEKMGLDPTLAQLDPSIAKEYVRDSLLEKLRGQLIGGQENIGIS
ncbi:hypothetical protein, partial [Anaplasma marginale]|uniref:hypothetical protein n=1 Tax=Anaplasma marginale TaxID=770 RepID=UPI001300C89F